MAYTILPASSSTLGEVGLISSTASGSPDTLHTITTDNATARVSLWLRNISAGADSVYVRVNDGSTTGAYQQYDFPAPSASEVNVGTWIWANEILVTDGTTDLNIEAYADTTLVFEYKLTINEES